MVCFAVAVAAAAGSGHAHQTNPPPLHPLGIVRSCSVWDAPRVRPDIVLPPVRLLASVGKGSGSTRNPSSGSRTGQPPAMVSSSSLRLLNPVAGGHGGHGAES
uniref:Putative secreted protein n=1 Tax=Anopheles darlingi TaxID=43151 RepID=A0A2M4DMD0_ANODA